MNWAASHLASRKVLQGAVQKAEEGKSGLFQVYVIYLWETKEGYVADYLIGADQKIQTDQLRIPSWGRL